MRRGAPELTEAQVLAWADALHARTGRWPTALSGRITGALGENWRNVDACLRRGGRGLPGGSSLARLLADRRGRRNHKALPHLTLKQILAWADQYHRAQGAWPNRDAGAISGSHGESWSKVVAALEQGCRGLPSGWSLPRLLARYRGVRNIHDLPRLTEKQILAWADAHHEEAGRWPTYNSGAIPGSGGETWMAVHMALTQGNRGCPGGSSLTSLLARRRGLRHSKRLPPLTRAQILAWADAWHARTGRWPTKLSGPIPGTGETWLAIDHVLYRGRRGLTAGLTLARFLDAERGVRNIHDLPPLNEKDILSWADRHHARHGAWPHAKSGLIPEAPGETWASIDRALSKGVRGLRRITLPQLLARRRGVPNLKARPPLTAKQLHAWARAHRRRTGAWPTANSGPVVGAPGEGWQAIDAALRVGVRGLPDGSSLFRFLKQCRP